VASTDRRGAGGRALDARWLRAIRLAVLTLAAAAAASAPASSGYLAVFVDGRTLHVEQVDLTAEGQARLSLPGGGSIVVPLTRLDRVIEDAVEENPRPLPAPRCGSAFVDQPLPGGTPFARLIMRASRSANLHPWLVAAVVQTESGFEPGAVSRVGARGLMQLMPSVWVEEGIRDPHDPAANLAAGCRHLRALLDRFGDLRLALAAYNSGAATVEHAGGVPPYRETREFVRRVLAIFCPAPSAHGESTGGGL
jgi:hypothetical protein